jgi:hypothetical protein
VIEALTKLVKALAAGKADGTVALVEACVKTIAEAVNTGSTEGALNDVSTHTVYSKPTLVRTAVNYC